MGSLGDLLEKLPFFPGGIPEDLNVDDRELVKIESIIQSMSKKERLDVSLFDKQPGRMTRVAMGSGRELKDVKGLIERFNAMRDMMGNIGAQAGMLGKIPGMKQLAMANKLKGAMGNDMPGIPGMPGMPGGAMGGLTQEMLQAAVADQGAPGQRRSRSASGKAKAKAKRKQAKKSRKKSRR
jgi:signal recognition particle subunit SRP54